MTKNSLGGKSFWYLTMLSVLAMAVFACCGGGGGGGGGNGGSAKKSRIEFTSQPASTATAGVLYTYTPALIGSYGDTLSYIVVTTSSGITIDPATGVVSWTPTLPQVGNHWLELKVTDGETTVSQKFSVRVNPTNNGVPFIHACTLTSWWWEDYLGLGVESSLRRMHENGCDTVLILITWYQDSTSATTIYSRAQKSPTDAGVTHVTNYAHSLGMKVFFKMHVDIPSGTWRGEIKSGSEGDWTSWFASYDAYMAHYLDLATSLDVEGFIIGTELVGTEGRDANWRNTVALARGKFTGLITYGANHDSYSAITWWDAVDFIGISGYFPLTASYTPTVADLNTAWNPWISALSTFATAKSKDIVFLELGYQSFNGTNTTPWSAPTSAVDLQEQADCYQAAFESLYDEPWFKGMSWWMWYWDPIQNVDGFDVYKKPAENILRYWYAGN